MWLIASEARLDCANCSKRARRVKAKIRQEFRGVNVCHGEAWRDAWVLVLVLMRRERLRASVQSLRTCCEWIQMRQDVPLAPSTPLA